MLCAYDSRQSLFVFFIVQRFVASFSTILQSDADRETVAIYSLLSVTRTICNLRFTMRICNDCHDKALLSSSFIGISLFVHLICVQSVIPFRSEASQRRNMNAEFSDKHVRLSQSYMLCVNMLQTIDISIFRYLSHSLSMQTLQMHGFIHTHTCKVSMKYLLLLLLSYDTKLQFVVILFLQSIFIGHIYVRRISFSQLACSRF